MTVQFMPQICETYVSTGSNVSLAFLNSGQFRFAGFVRELVDGGDGDRPVRCVESQAITGFNSGPPLYTCRDS